ncbi:class I SAM-dependent methyltransferase [Kiloniella majae]|uniref:class I SAM-dependent methyltransferase n=1 Tax=Kiloniella majae TaxID=1938558 RepID=UPI00130248DE|nr:class I SAM-dependent methyltransferase [Kiloniella majae]
MKTLNAARFFGPVISRSDPVIVMRDHYYSPIPTRSDFIEEDFFEKVRDLPGLDIDAVHISKYMREELPQALAVFRKRLPAIFEKDTKDGFYLVNGRYMAVDAHIYFATILINRPKRIVEIGSGSSTQVAVEACQVLQDEGHAVELCCIEPYPPQEMINLIAQKKVTLIEDLVQNVALDVFTSLEAGDILFIDSTHVLREGSDVQYEYLEILPRLKPGVHVHIHDISLPKRYPEVYFTGGLYWNEQYFLQAYLINNSKVQITWPGNYMMCHHADLMLETFPEIKDMRSVYPSSEPSAFWFKICT